MYKAGTPVFFWVVKFLYLSFVPVMNTLESNVRQQLRVRESVWMCVYNYVKTTFFCAAFFFFD